MATASRQRGSSPFPSSAIKPAAQGAITKGAAAKSPAATSKKPAAPKAGKKTVAAPTGKANSMNRAAAARGTKPPVSKTKPATSASRAAATDRSLPGKKAATTTTAISAPSTARKSIGESKSKRPSTKREPQVDVLAQQAAAKEARESAVKQKPKRADKVEADDRTSRSAGRHSGASDAEYIKEKGDARRRDPDVNKNSQAQKDDVRDGQRDQDPHPKKRSDGGKLQDGGGRQAQASRSRPAQTTGPTRK